VTLGYFAFHDRTYRTEVGFQHSASMVGKLAVLGALCSIPAEFGHTLELFFGRGVPKSIFVRSGSKSVFRTHKHQNAQNFETNPMGPVPGSETHISRKKSFNFLIGARIFLGNYQSQTSDRNQQPEN